MIKARVQWQNQDDVVKRLERRAAHLSGKETKMFGELQQLVYQSTSINFASSGRPRWKERSPGYRAWAEQKYGTFWPPLLRTGKLFDTTLNSIQRPWQHQGKKHLLNINSMYYGYFHQYGKGQAIRKYLNLTAAEKKAGTAIIKKYLKGNI